MRLRFLCLVFPFILTGCDFLAGINTTQFPPQDRGVVDGLPSGQRKITDLQEYGIILADSRDGTHIILPADKVFGETIDRVTINPDFLPAMNQLVYILKGYPKVKIAIVGHTDGVMTDALEEKQSSRYAYVVANYLTSAGISPLRITSVRGVAHTQPIDGHHNLQARAVNRRVEVITEAPLK